MSYYTINKELKISTAFKAIGVLPGNSVKKVSISGHFLDYAAKIKFFPREDKPLSEYQQMLIDMDKEAERTIRLNKEKQEKQVKN